MAYQVKTTTSYGQRVSNSFKGIFTGILLFIAGTILLFWNEGNFVKTQKAINEAQSVVVKVDNVDSQDPNLNGKLIYGVSVVKTDDILQDGLFDVSVNAVKLSRKVEYYQWKEKSETQTRDKIGGGEEKITTYTYSKDWVSSPIKSSEFQDPQYQSSNTVLTNIENKDVVADNVTWGAYELPGFLKSAVSGTTPAEIQLSEPTKAEWQKTLQQSTPNRNTTTEYLHVSGNTVYIGANPSTPTVGDLRVTITYTPPGGDLSVIAQVQGNTFTQYVAKNGKQFSSVQNGTVSAEQMFESEHASNSMWTWILRILGVFMVIGGLKSMFGILPTLFKVLPFLSNIVGAGVGLVSSIFGFVWSLIIIAIAWLFYRPLIGIAIIAIAVAGIWFLKKKAKEKKLQQLPVEQPPTEN